MGIDVPHGASLPTLLAELRETLLRLSAFTRQVHKGDAGSPCDAGVGVEREQDRQDGYDAMDHVEIMSTSRIFLHRKLVTQFSCGLEPRRDDLLILPNERLKFVILAVL